MPIDIVDCNVYLKSVLFILFLINFYKCIILITI